MVKCDHVRHFEVKISKVIVLLGMHKIHHFMNGWLYVALKMRDWKTNDQFAGAKYARPENGVLENARPCRIWNHDVSEKEP